MWGWVSVLFGMEESGNPADSSGLRIWELKALSHKMAESLITWMALPTWVGGSLFI